ncbi:alpha-hydroxy acid oxidase [Acuticoccus sp. MNP-M23]|uniref:alpha-hydroxy acid oxidase n=1 Tax=Acuticoccus sp. MNP-M23 TaxID=3072793 RepID=UPI0028162E2E|nr:alpha-hydroxy acid oxidase [Acuticoccus sp. MNP-M23]WMS43927.1 alpha-hydroxy acid oxidase [Acuticoccus sp. MNP-M23]
MLLNAHDFRARARRRLPRGVFEYIDRGTEDERALGNLRSALDAITLEPRVLNGPGIVPLATQLFGRKVAAPLVIAPTAMAGLVCYDGEARLARAAARVGVPFCVATQSITPIETIREAAPDADLWFQLYLWRDRGLASALLARAAACGCRTLVVTVDNQVAPNREYNERNGFGVPVRPTVRNALDVACHPGWALGVLARYILAGGMPTYAHYPPAFRSAITRPALAEAVRIEPALSFADIAWIRENWPGRVVLKGVLSVADARRCMDAGVEAIVVSAHGGRNLDVAPTPASCLAGIAASAEGRMNVLADSGVRRGTDVLKYLALGAEAVMLGRLPLYGLAAGGEAGAEAVLRMIMREMEIALGYLGASALRDLTIAPD